jgi:hypothetical protein
MPRRVGPPRSFTAMLCERSSTALIPGRVGPPRSFTAMLCERSSSALIPGRVGPPRGRRRITRAVRRRGRRRRAPLPRGSLAPPRAGKAGRAGRAGRGWAGRGGRKRRRPRTSGSSGPLHGRRGPPPAMLNSHPHTPPLSLFLPLSSLSLSLFPLLSLFPSPLLSLSSAQTSGFRGTSPSRRGLPPRHVPQSGQEITVSRPHARERARARTHERTNARTRARTHTHAEPRCAAYHCIAWCPLPLSLPGELRRASPSGRSSCALPLPVCV